MIDSIGEAIEPTTELLLASSWLEPRHDEPAKGGVNRHIVQGFDSALRTRTLLL
jgi:hypothetical protein